MLISILSLLSVASPLLLLLLLLLLPPVRDDFFGKAHLALRSWSHLLVMSFPGLQLSRPSGSFLVSVALCLDFVPPLHLTYVIF